MYCLNTVLIASVLSGMLNGITYGRYMDEHGVHRRNADIKWTEYSAKIGLMDPDCRLPACDIVDLMQSGRKKRSKTQPSQNLNTPTLLDLNEQ